MLKVYLFSINYYLYRLFFCQNNINPTGSQRNLCFFAFRYTFIYILPGKVIYMEWFAGLEAGDMQDAV